jgi:CRISPR/Cas system-associated protein Cas5 (RAMP superfamily)
LKALLISSIGSRSKIRSVTGLRRVRHPQDRRKDPNTRVSFRHPKVHGHVLIFAKSWNSIRPLLSLS